MISWTRIAAIIRREYLERVKTKAFWISTLLVPVFLGAVMIIPAWLASRGGGTFTVAVLDFTGRFAEPLRAELDDMLTRQTSTAHRGPRRGRYHPGRTGRDHGRDGGGVSPRSHPGPPRHQRRSGSRPRGCQSPCSLERVRRSAGDPRNPARTKDRRSTLRPTSRRSRCSASSSAR